MTDRGGNKNNGVSNTNKVAAAGVGIIGAAGFLLYKWLNSKEEEPPIGMMLLISKCMCITNLMQSIILEHRQQPATSSQNLVESWIFKEYRIEVIDNFNDVGPAVRRLRK